MNEQVASECDTAGPAAPPQGPRYSIRHLAHLVLGQPAFFNPGHALRVHHSDPAHVSIPI